MEPVKFVIEDYTIDAPANAVGYVAQCTKCDQTFKNKRAFVIKRHHETKHKAEFIPQRTRQQISSVDNGAETKKMTVSQMKIIAAKIRTEIKSLVRGRLVNLLLNIGSRNKKSCICVGLQFITRANIRIVHLGLIVVLYRYSANFLRERIAEILSKYEINMDQIYTITTDNGTNVIAASEKMLHDAAGKVLVGITTQSQTYAEPESPHIPTDDDTKSTMDVFAIYNRDHEDGEPESQFMLTDSETDHTRDVLALYNGDHEDLEAEFEMMSLIEKEMFMDEATPLSTRSPAHIIQLAVHDALTEYKEQVEGLKENDQDIQMDIVEKRFGWRLLPKPNATHWGSTYHMLFGMLKPEIRERYTDHLTEEDWRLIEELADALAPVGCLSVSCQKEQYIFGDLFVDILLCESRVSNINTPFATKLKETLKRRKGEILHKNIQKEAALFMDPRFNYRTSSMFTSEQKREIIEYLADLHKRIESLKQRARSENKPNSSSPYPSPNEDKIATFNRLMGIPEKFSIEDRLNDLGVTLPPTGEIDVQEYWQNTGVPELCDLADVVLSVSSSQVSVERAFNSLPLIFPSQRNRLGDRELELLLFVRLNRSLIDEK